MFLSEYGCWYGWFVGTCLSESCSGRQQVDLQQSCVIVVAQSALICHAPVYDNNINITDSTTRQHME